MLNFIINFLKSRKFQVKIKNTPLNQIIQENSVPQGSTISVTLFLIAINDITANTTPPIFLTLHADNLNFFCRNKNSRTLHSENYR